MKKLWLLALLCLFPLLSTAAENFDDAEVKHIDYPEWFDKSDFNDLSEVLETATAANKQGLMVLFTTEGCSYCHRFIEKSLGDPQLQQIVRDHFATIGFEMLDDTELTSPQGEAMPIKTFAKQHKAEMAPSLLFFDGNGKKILSAVGYQTPERFQIILDYLTGKHYLNMPPKEYLASLKQDKMASAAVPELPTDELFAKPPFNLDRSQSPAGKQLLVLFEKPDCPECKDFHQNVLSLPEIREQLAKLEVVQLNADDKQTEITTPAGAKTSPADWFQNTEFSYTPALLFFDENGNEVLKTDTLVKHTRMMNALSYVLERSYEQDMLYQKHARNKGVERLQNKE